MNPPPQSLLLFQTRTDDGRKGQKQRIISTERLHPGILLVLLLFCTVPSSESGDVFSRKHHNNRGIFSTWRKKSIGTRSPHVINNHDGGNTATQNIDDMLTDDNSSTALIEKKDEEDTPSGDNKDKADTTPNSSLKAFDNNNKILSTTSSEWSTSVTNNESVATALLLAFKKFMTFDRALTITRIGIGYFLITQIWNQCSLIWDEWMDELESQSSSHNYEHESPFISPDIIKDSQQKIDNGSENNKENNNPKSSSGGRRQASRRGKQQQFQNTQAYDLANRLHKTGLPMSIDNTSRRNTTNASSSAPPSQSIPQILATLTKTEAQILSSSLLVPSTSSLPHRPLAGLSELQSSLNDILHTLVHAPQNTPFSSLLGPPPGILFYGPPGCGKTLLARTLAHEHRHSIRFLHVSPSTLLRKYVGETNLNVRALFSLASKIRPCVIFVDEMDGLFRERSSDEHDWSRDLKTEFAALWDGLVKDEMEAVMIIGATNRPFDIDPAFLRRLSRRFFLGLPHFPARVELLQRFLEGVPLEEGFCTSCIAGKMEGYSPSDVKEVLRAAAMIPYREGRKDGLKMEDVARGLERVRPTRWGSEYREKLREWTMRDDTRGLESEEYSEEEEDDDDDSDNVEVVGFEVHEEEMGDWESSDDLDFSDGLDDNEGNEDED